MTTVSSISEEEAALYDRQIRLWGVEAQNQLKNARILQVGMTALGAEVAKNLVLAGVNSLTVIDNHSVSDSDISANFFIPTGSEGQKRSTAAVPLIQKLNPMVKVSASDYTLGELGSNITNYDVVVLLLDLLEEDLLSMEQEIMSFSKISGKAPHFVLATVFSYFGMAFFDFGLHEFIAEENRPKKPGAPVGQTTEQVISKKVVEYPRFEDSLNTKWNDGQPINNRVPFVKTVPKCYFLMQILRKLKANKLPVSLEELHGIWSNVAASLGVNEAVLTDKDMECCCGPQIPSVNPVLGGIVSQEIVRGITRKGEPYGNWCFFDGIRCSAVVDWMPRVDARVTSD